MEQNCDERGKMRTFLWLLFLWLLKIAEKIEKINVRTTGAGGARTILTPLPTLFLALLYNIYKKQCMMMIVVGTNFSIIYLHLIYINNSFNICYIRQTTVFQNLKNIYLSTSIH